MKKPLLRKEILSWWAPRRPPLADPSAQREGSRRDIVAGWLAYYGRFYRSKLYSLLRRINSYLMRWARQKYRRLRSFKACHAWWRGLIDREPTLFRHWAWMRDV
jgi:RNA-directed DNA polymerase